MKQWKRLTAFFLALLMAVTTNAANVWAGNETRASGLVYSGKVSYHGYEVGVFTVDGETAFCMAHNKFNPPSGAGYTDNIYDNENVRRVLYYGMNGTEPWSGFEDAVHARVLTSLALSYYYYGLPTFGEGDYIYQQGKLRAFLNYCESHPAPDDDISLSKTSVKAYLEQNQQRTETITLTADTRNSITLTLPENVTLYNVTKNTTHIGTATIGGGNTFYLTAPLTMSGTWKTGNVPGSMKKLQAVVSVPEGNYQPLGRPRWWQDPTSVVNLSVDWLDQGYISIQKVDSETDEAVPQGAASGFEGVKYDVFQKAAYQEGDNAGSASYVTTITLDENGQGKSGLLQLGSYYVIEREAPDGYNIDPIRHEATLPSAETNPLEVHVTSKEDVIRGDVEIIKVGENKNPDEDALHGLAGAEFTFISKTTGEAVTVIATDREGFATTKSEEYPRGSLPFDTYTVTETKVPEGYEPVAPFDVTIAEEGVTLKGIYKEDKLIVSPVKVVKVDATTGRVIPVKNTEFRLLDANQQPVTMVTNYPETVTNETFLTDEKGQFTFPQKLYAGTYYPEEVNAPEGYLKGGLLKFEVTQTADWTDPLVVRYEDAPVKGKIHLLKVDAGTKKPLPAGAEFQITAKEDIVTPDGTVHATKGAVVDTIVTDGSSQAESAELYPGTYLVRETKAVPGYVLDQKDVEVTLQAKDQNTPVVVKQVEIGNQPAKGIIQVKKLDETTGNILPAGAEFQITAKEDIVTPDGTVRVKAGEVADTIMTNKNGLAISKELFLGTYQVKETKAPEGYLLNEAVYDVELRYQDQNTELVYESLSVEDAPAMGRIDITKTDADTNEVIPFGAVFEIRAKEDIVTLDGTVRVKAGDLADTVTTDQEGKAVSKELFLGAYTVKEIQAPVGFVLDPTEREVTLTYQDQLTPLVSVELQLANKPTEIRILKTIQGTEEPLPGVTFQVRNKAFDEPENLTDAGNAGDDVLDEMGQFSEADLEETDPGMVQEETFVTDENGQIILKRLMPGTYRIQEVQTAEGYVLDAAIREITISPDGRIDGEETGIVRVENDITKVEVSKQDATTGKELPGAKLEIYHKTEEGKELVESWTSTDKPHMIEKLVAGETYILHEDLAPVGYEFAQDVEFTVENTGEIQKVVMKDEAKTITIKTGDHNTYVPYLMLLVVSMAIAAGVMMRKRGNFPGKNRKEKR